MEFLFRPDETFMGNLKKIQISRLLLLSVSGAILFTELIVVPLSILFHGRIVFDYLVSGAVAAFFVSLLVAYILVRLIKRLREDEERYRMFVENANDGIFIAQDGLLKAPNARLTGMLGAPFEEIDGRPFSGFIYPEDLTMVAARHKQRLDGASDLPSTYVFRIKSKDGTPLWVELSTVIVTWKGKPATLNFLRDISDRKRMEEELHARDAQLRIIFDTSHAGIMLGDPDGVITLANGRMAEMFGCALDELVGSRYMDLLHPEDRETGGRNLRGLIEGDIAYVHTERRYIRKDGGSFWGHLSGRRYEAADGKLIALVGVISDISDHKKLEEELLRTQKLESLGILAGGIAHDFNNLLQGVFGYITMAKMNLLERERADIFLDKAEKAINMSVNLTGQLLTFSRGGNPLKKRIALHRVIENSVGFALSGSRSDCRIAIDKDLRYADADEGQIGQVIQNMVLNASEAMPEGGTVVVSATNVVIPKGINSLLPEGGWFVRIDIKDSGIGIPLEHQLNIFDPYFTTKQKGSGLGLATSYSIVRNHGGVIELESEPDKGSAFSIFLPAADSGEEKTIPATVCSPTRKGRVLLMDDEEMVRNVAVEMMHALGHELTCAADGEDAIRAFVLAREAGRPFDVVILDLTVQGEGMGGEKTIRKLLAIEPKVKAVVSSGYADNPVVADYRSYGFTTCLNKPYTIDALKVMLNELLGG